MAVRNWSNVVSAEAERAKSRKFTTPLIPLQYTVPASRHSPDEGAESSQNMPSDTELPSWRHRQRAGRSRMLQTGDTARSNAALSNRNTQAEAPENNQMESEPGPKRRGNRAERAAGHVVEDFDPDQNGDNGQAEALAASLSGRRHTPQTSLSKARPSPHKSHRPEPQPKGRQRSSHEKVHQVRRDGVAHLMSRDSHVFIETVDSVPLSTQQGPSEPNEEAMPIPEIEATEVSTIPLEERQAQESRRHFARSPPPIASRRDDIGTRQISPRPWNRGSEHAFFDKYSRAHPRAQPRSDLPIAPPRSSVDDTPDGSDMSRSSEAAPAPDVPGERPLDDRRPLKSIKEGVRDLLSRSHPHPLHGKWNSTEIRNVDSTAPKDSTSTDVSISSVNGNSGSSRDEDLVSTTSPSTTSSSVRERIARSADAIERNLPFSLDRRPRGLKVSFNESDEVRTITPRSTVFVSESKDGV